MAKPMRRPGGNWSVSRGGFDKTEHYQTILYEIEMLRFSYGRILRPPDGATYGDLWAYLESFLVHYRNLVHFFSKDNDGDGTDLVLACPTVIWERESGLDHRRPKQEDIENMRAIGRELWREYEDRKHKNDTISKYLQHCTTYRIASKEWFPVEMMSKIKAVLEKLESSLPAIKWATSQPVDRDDFLGGHSMSTHSGMKGQII